MALKKELLKVLDDESEPLPKRLKLADNAFKTSKLQIQSREVILFNWIGVRAKEDDFYVWTLLLNWLTSQQVRELSRNDITLNDLRSLINVISDGLISTKNNKQVIINCAITVIENRTFQLFFKHDICNYCTFVSQIMNHIEDPQTLANFMTNEQLFNRYLIASEDFTKYFIKDVVISIGNVLEKFSSQTELFLELSAVVEKCLFHRNFKIFSAYFKTIFDDEVLVESTSKLPKLLIKSLIHSLNNTSLESNHIYKITFYAFCTSYNNNFDFIYKFFILLIETLGFDMSSYCSIKKLRKFNNTSCSVNKSIAVLTELCQVLTEFNKELNYKVNEIVFTEMLKNITISVISLVYNPNLVVYKFLDCIIVIDPLITEQILNDLLVYVMLSNKEETKAVYDKFLITVFEVFAKLHRIPNLISKMIPTLKTALEGNFQHTSSIVNFCGLKEQYEQHYSFENMMPEKVLDYFHQCVTKFSSWQVINLFKTFLFHFESAVCGLSAASEDRTKFIYVETISFLIEQFLCSVRIAEHTTATSAVEKFVKNMEDLRNLLKIFGTTLVKIEHDPTLMRAYLNICHAWGELYVVLAFYSTDNEIVLPKTLDNDSSACNITYIHSYLTRDQWRLISQRITNFGEKPCKQILNKLYTQKLKAMMLFESSVNDDVLTAIRSGILSLVDDNWRDLISDPIVLSHIISSTNCKTAAELLLHDITKTKNFNQISLVYDNYDIISMILYTCILKINKIFKRRYKSSNLNVEKLFISKVCLCITEDLFFNSNDNSLITLRNVFVQEISENCDTNVSGQFNDTEISSYMKVIENIPMIQYNNSVIQELSILFLFSVLLELRRNVSVQMQLVKQCESIIIGIAQNYLGSFRVLIEPFTTLEVIIRSFDRYTDLFAHIIHNIFKFEKTYISLNDGINFLTKNIKQEEHLNCLILVLKYINKYKKSKISVESKELLIEYQETIFKGVLQLIQHEKRQPNLTEAYALILKHKLTKQNDEVTELLPFLDKYINGILQDKNKMHIRGSLLLFTTILRNKGKIRNVTDDISLKAWNYCQFLEDKKSEEFAELVVLIIEHIPNEQFVNIVKNLLKYAVDALRESSCQKFIDELSIWNIILASNLNPIKLHEWQTQLESLLLKHVLPYLSKDGRLNENKLYEHIVKLEINIVQRVQLPLTALLIDAIFLTISTITTNQTCEFQNVFVSSIMLLQMLLKFRKSQMMDYLPGYLQRYRTLLKLLCIKSNANSKFEIDEEQQISDCAHKLEKLTNNLVSCNKHVMRIAPYLVADILKQYEKITLLPNVKMHLNNCVYSLISLCDEYAISYLMRCLSTASTEMFKVIYENYKKYYKFTGRV